MNSLTSLMPLTLYIHIPWCVKKCPYCDFNSHAVKTDWPEGNYIQALLQDLKNDAPLAQGREVEAIFIGGGTPSLFSAESIAELLKGVKRLLPLKEDIEITLEANPGTVEQDRFNGYREAGVNRLSLGVQSFQAEKLKALGRIHNEREAILAVQAAKNAGFDNFNIDLMYGLPNQSVEDALYDLQSALALGPTHLSWYQLTLEPNTAFFKAPPPLPQDDETWEMQVQGQGFLASKGFAPYEISAYTNTDFTVDRRSRHNLNYWLFGDYLGIGAGAHSKITDARTKTISRTWKVRHPKDYLNKDASFIGGHRTLGVEEIPFEFMLNTLRLYQSMSWQLFEQRTGLDRMVMASVIRQARDKGLLHEGEGLIETTPLGKRYLNDLLALFM